MTYPTKVDWDAADWRLSDRELAARLGVSRQRVFQKRKRLGAPAPLLKNEPLRVRVARLPIEELTTVEMAERLGAHRASIAKVCREIGREPKPSLGTYDRHDTIRERLEALDTASMTMDEIIAALGVEHANKTYFYNLVARHKIPYRRVWGRRKA